MKHINYCNHSSPFSYYIVRTETKEPEPSSSSESEDDTVDPDKISVVNGDITTAWTVIREEKNIELPAIYDRAAYFKWPVQSHGLEKNPFSYFLLFWPNDVMNRIVQLTSAKLQEKGRPPLTKGEMYKWLGIRLYMCLHPVRGSLPTYWNDSKENGSTFMPHNMKQVSGMSRHRFENITEMLCIYEPEGEGDRPVSIHIPCTRYVCFSLSSFICLLIIIRLMDGIL